MYGVATSQPQLQGSLVAADFNGDHKLDLAVAIGAQSDAVSILLGNGDGTFQNSTDLSLPTSSGAPVSLAAADFNHDGKIDLGVGSLAIGGDASVSIFQGNGDGTFILDASYSVFFSYSAGVTVGDFNGDGNPDLVVPGATTGAVDSAATVFLGNGDGTFQPGMTYGTVFGPSSLAAADFNGDGKLDLAAGGAGAVSILLGLGDGTFVGKRDYGAGSSFWMTTADLNADGNLDLVNAVDGGSVSVLLGNRDGTFQASTSFPAGIYTTSVAPGDFNSDGTQDLVTVNLNCPLSNASCGNPGFVSILLGDGTGSFQPAVDYTVGVSPQGVAVGDFNQDGKLDLAVTNASSNSYSVLLGNGDGTFQTQKQYSISGPSGIASGDFNGDGKLDLAVTTNSSVAILLGNGDGTFQLPINSASSSGPSIVAVDLNGDGRLDLALASSSGVISILLGNGDGTFQPATTFPGEACINCSSILAVGDFNGDGKLDVAVGGGLAASVLLGNGDGTFQSATQYLMANQNLSSLAVGDFNGDGVPDWVAADLNTGTDGVMLSTPFKSVSPASLNFGSQGVGTTSLAKQIVISNPSNVPFVISSLSATGEFAETNDCGSSLQPGANCSVNISYSPTTTGLESGTLTIIDGTRSSPESVPLSGTGVNGAFLTPSPGRLSFGAVDVGVTTPSAAIVLLNTGNTSLNLSNVSILGSDFTDFAQTNNCGSSLAQGASCTVNVTFTPTTGGTRIANLSIGDNAQGSPQVVSLVGNGTAPVASLGVTLLSFASRIVGTTSPAQTVTLTNTGSAPLNITQIAASGDFAVTNTCGTSLAVGDACTVSVTFTPAASGTRSGSVSITDNAAGSPQSITLSGTATSASLGLGIASGSLSSQTVAAGTTATYQLSIGGGGITGTATLTCTGAPAGATCSVPSSETVSATTAANFTVTITTTSRTSAGLAPLSKPSLGWMWAFVVLGMFVLPSAAGEKGKAQRLLRWLPLTLLLFICSCGGGSSSSSPPPTNPNGTPAGQYTLTVTATSGSTTQSTNLTLKVQ